MPLPPAGELKVRDVTHSEMKLFWDAAPGPVRKYHVTYQPEDGEVKEVWLFLSFTFKYKTNRKHVFPIFPCIDIMFM